MGELKEGFLETGESGEWSVSTRCVGSGDVGGT